MNQRVYIENDRTGSAWSFNEAGVLIEAWDRKPASDEWDWDSATVYDDLSAVSGDTRGLVEVMTARLSSFQRYAIERTDA